jgi:hypothetical protein
MLRPQQRENQISQENQGNQATDSIFPSHGVLLQPLGHQHVTPRKDKEDHRSRKEKQVYHTVPFALNYTPAVATAISDICKD